LFAGRKDSITFQYVTNSVQRDQNSALFPDINLLLFPPKRHDPMATMLWHDWYANNKHCLLTFESQDLYTSLHAD